LIVELKDHGVHAPPIPAVHEIMGVGLIVVVCEKTTAMKQQSTTATDARMVLFFSLSVGHD
jgi:hypothetical protein